jgi:hypothetical protein
MPDPRRHSLLLALAVAGAALAGCRPGGEAGPAEGAAAVEEAGRVTEAEAIMAIDAVTVGTALGADGAVAPAAAGRSIRPGDTVHLSMEVGDASAGAEVRVVWYAPDGVEISGEARRVAPGGGHLSFSLDTARLAPGVYLAEVWYQDELVTEEEIDVGAGPPEPPGS